MTVAEAEEIEKPKKKEAMGILALASMIVFILY